MDLSKEFHADELYCQFFTVSLLMIYETILAYRPLPDLSFIDLP